VKPIRMRGVPIRPAILATIVAAALAGPALAAGGLFGTPVPAEPLAGERILVAQNNQNSAELLVRLQELEQLVRTLTGRIEGLEFQLTQMQTQLAKQAEDNEFRFQELEGGAVGKPQAAAPTDGATPSDTLPQTPAQTLPPQDASATAGVAPLAPADAGAPLDDLGGAPMHSDVGIGESADPLLSGGVDQLGTLSPDDALSLDPGRPLDLSLNAGGDISNGDARAQYAAGYDAMTRGDYAFAEDQLSQFIALYPDDPQAPDAINYLGEALIQRQAFTDAAEVLADGYTRHRDSNRAPDIMLKLGVALIGAGEQDAGCRTYFTLAQRYPNLAPAFQQRLAEEQQKAQCPVVN
jgi:tol-pal system protein YbgF